jgi:formylglycine-generating enzyme required for sulfatase activity
MFVEARLLVSGGGDEHDQVEITHEALLRTWPTLVGWLEEGREYLNQRRRVNSMCHDLSGPITESSLRSSLRELRRMASSTEGEEQRATKKMPLEPIFKIAAGNSFEEIPRHLAIDVLELHRSIQAKQYLKTIIFADDTPFLLRSKAVGALARSISLQIWPEIETEDHLLWKQIISEFTGRLFADGNTLFTNAGQNSIESNVKLELLQCASRGVQLDARKSTEMPILGQEKDFRVQMLTLTALRENTGLCVQAKLIEPRVWKLPLPHSGGRLEFVVIPGGQYQIGSPLDEKGRGREAEEIYRQTLGDCKDLDIEKIRSVSMEEFAMTRYPITQKQWQSVASLGNVTVTTSRHIDRKPTSFDGDHIESLEQSLAFLPVNNVNWHDCQEWLSRFNQWLSNQWKKLGTETESPTLKLPTEDQWEVACRAGSSTPFHFGESFHENWVNCNDRHYPLSLMRIKYRGTLPVGFSGVVNQLGLSDMHGQVYEWCENEWDPNPTQFDDTTDRYRPGRGGSWRNQPEYCRSAFRPGFQTNYRGHHLGFRVCCSLPVKSE